MEILTSHFSQMKEIDMKYIISLTKNYTRTWQTALNTIKGGGYG
jgi:hypothetical protein